jgi:hypothetical protein
MITPHLKRIAKGDGVILIDGEFDGAQRTIHMNVSTHDDAPASIQGHSIGRWEDKSLVIDTTRFAYYALGNGHGLPSGIKKHLVGRLTPGADGASLTSKRANRPAHRATRLSEFLAVSHRVDWAS